MVLPAKSIICMPCHTATFSIGDTVTVLSLILFLFGFFAVGSVWFSGGDPSVGTGRKLTKSTRCCVPFGFFKPTLCDD